MSWKVFLILAAISAVLGLLGWCLCRVGDDPAEDEADFIRYDGPHGAGGPRFLG